MDMEETQATPETQVPPVPPAPGPEETRRIAGIRFKRAGKMYFFDPAGIDLKLGDRVVVETARGREIGTVVIAPSQVLASEFSEPLKPVLNRATEEEVSRWLKFKAEEERVIEKAGEAVRKLQLPMKLLSAEYNLDGTKLTLSFSAEGRVDFRDLVRELTSLFKTRVELRQVGPRDEAKIVGGFGRCGRQLCCASFMSEFSPLSIKTAKEQDLPLNPTKISGTCGRLLCCLAYERDHYKEMKKRLPKLGTQVNTPSGRGIVRGTNTLKGTVTVETQQENALEVKVEDITPVPQDARS